MTKKDWRRVENNTLYNSKKGHWILLLKIKGTWRGVKLMKGRVKKYKPSADKKDILNLIKKDL